MILAHILWRIATRIQHAGDRAARRAEHRWRSNWGHR